MNGNFDHAVVLGIPVWVFVGVILGIVFLGVNLSWVFKMRRMAAVKGFKDVQKKASQEDVMTWMLNKTQKLTIECMRYVDSVISYRDTTKISKWHLTTPMSVIHVGGYPAMMISDDYDQTRDIVSEIALCHACEEFNHDQHWLAGYLDAMESKGVKIPEWMRDEGIAKPIESFSDYRDRGRMLLGMKYPEGIPIPSYSIFSPVKFRKFFPKGRSAGFMGGRFIRQARKLNLGLMKDVDWKAYLPLAGLITLGLVGLIAAWMVPLGK